MPLMHVVGMTSFNTIFTSCMAFLQSEIEADYKWALEQVRKIYGDTLKPKVIVTDRELALMNALTVIFPETHNLLCHWHIEKNILTHCI